MRIMSKQQVFYIHGGSSYSDYGAYLQDLQTKEVRDLPGVEVLKKWPATLREDLGEKYEVFMPAMPNANDAKYAEWKIWFERHFEYLHDDIILLGWSQGAYFLAKYLTENTLPIKPKALILLAAPFEPADFGGEDGGDFAFATNKVGELSDKVAKIFLMHSKDDFVVPYEHALKYQAALPEAELITYTDKNHFLVPELPELLQLIENLA